MSEREECVFEKAEELAREMNVTVTRVIGKVIDGRAELQIVGESNGTTVRLRVEG